MTSTLFRISNWVILVREVFRACAHYRSLLHREVSEETTLLSCSRDTLAEDQQAVRLLFLPHGRQPWVFRERVLEFHELLDRVHLVPGQPLLQDLDPKHRLRLKLLELSLVLWCVWTHHL